jgi:uncharacterized repeat protein (TIGR03847 family)
VVVVIDDETWIIWMEKQQMQALGMAIEQILAQAASAGGPLESSNAMAVIDERTTNQFRLGRVELGFDDGDDSIVLIAHDVQADDDDPGLNLRISQAQSRTFIRDSAALAAAGRPMCPMCGHPRDPSGHVCPEQNGLLPLPIDEAFLTDG